MSRVNGTDGCARADGGAASGASWPSTTSAADACSVHSGRLQSGSGAPTRTRACRTRPASRSSRSVSPVPSATRCTTCTRRCWPMRSTRPTRCSSRIGFHGSSRLITMRQCACRFSPSPAASVASSTPADGNAASAARRWSRVMPPCTTGAYGATCVRRCISVSRYSVKTITGSCRRQSKRRIRCSLPSVPTASRAALRSCASRRCSRPTSSSAGAPHIGAVSASSSSPVGSSSGRRSCSEAMSGSVSSSCSRRSTDAASANGLDSARLWSSVSSSQA